jgi:hypothetical protein
MPSKYTKKVETQVLEYVKTLKPDMSPTDVKALFDELEEQHAIVEAKLIVVGVIYRSVLNDLFEREEREILLPAGFR